MSDTKWRPANLKAPLKHVQHANLRRFNEESEYKSLCPVCEAGVLLVGRDQETLQLVRYDRCTHCAQAFIYDDELIGGETLKALPENYEQKIAASVAHIEV